MTLQRLTKWLPKLWVAAGKPAPSKWVSWKKIAFNMVTFGIVYEQLGPIFIQLKNDKMKSPMGLISKTGNCWKWQRLLREYNARKQPSLNDLLKP